MMKKYGNDTADRALLMFFAAFGILILFGGVYFAIVGDIGLISMLMLLVIALIIALTTICLVFLDYY